MLQVNNVAKSFGGQVVLRDVSFHVNPSERVGLVGANGTGKSTVIKILVGEIEPDEGQVIVTPRTTVGYLSQVNQIDAGHTLYEEMLSVFAEANALEHRQRQIEAEMQSCPATDPRFELLLDEYGRVLHDFEQADGYLIKAKIGQVLSGLGFQREDADRPVEHFSGGWQMRVSLAKLLLASPNLLLLDEPTNHLDLRATEWLEDYLRDYKASVVVVSHDRYFLDRVTQRTLELEDGTVADYAGNYSAYCVEKAQRQETQMAAFKRQQVEIARQETFVNRFRAKATKAPQVKSREKLLARLDRVEAPDHPARGIKLRFPPAPPSGREAIVFKDLAKSYGQNLVFQGGQLIVERGDRMAVIGPNGTGKSTLLRILASIESPTRGSVWLGHGVILSYFAQDQAETVDSTKTVIEEMYGAAPSDTSLTDVRGILGRFLLSGDDAFKKAGQLSGGERSRLALAKMLLRPANVLLLDEPTNHLDLRSIEALEEALQSFQGTAVLVSHDRRFVDRVATKVLEIENGRLTLYPGNYTYYHDKKRAMEIAQAAPEPPRPKQPPRQVAQVRNGSVDVKRRITDIERRIAELEATLATIEEELGRPEIYQDSQRAADLAKEYGVVKEQVDLLTEEWVIAHD